MAGLWQRTGNVSVTNGSKTVTGFGTKWKTGVLPIQKGHTFYGPDNAAYEVDTVVSDESILLVDAYRGGTLTNQAYRIDITRTSTISQFAADLASLVGKYRTWFDGMMTWLTGSGDVSILNPDTGANTTIPSWKKVASEGEGQTARAKVEADRAKTEADRALTEADRAAGIVAAAALPLPDVWAPLSDSLRMITGYGRDVLVGSDVVARMVNFSRSSTATYIGKDGLLKTAAVNEPRFEKEGLLIEGQSTNLVPNSKNPPPTSSETRVTLVASPYGDVFKFAAATTNNSMKDVRFAPLTAGQLVTLSFIAKKAEIDTVAIGLDGMFFVLFNLTSVSVGSVPSGSSATITPIGDGFYRATLTTTTTRDVTPSLRLKVNGTFVANAVGDGMLIGNIQAELLPFASSYIPTNGAAATRAADVAKLPQARNIPDLLGSSYSIAARFTLKPGVSKAFRFLFRTGNILSEAMGIVQVNSGAKLRAYQGSSELVNNVVGLPFVEGSSFVCGLGIRSGKVVGYSSMDREVVANPSLFTPTSNPADFLLGDLWLMSNYQTTNEAWGHIRDLRIWWQALSDAQWKVVS